MPADLPATFVDTNIWLYAFIESDEPGKSSRAREALIQITPIISTQVIHEVCVNLLKKGGFTEDKIRVLVADFYQKYLVIETDKTVSLNASHLRERYSLSFWDSLIVACALESGAAKLYSEDLQHNMTIEGRLTILNPL